MEPAEIKKGIYWVGGIDWDVRNFHGYLTQRGTTYNSYLIVDEKITLIDTVKHGFYDEMVERISKIIEPSKIDYIVSNHVEMDHTGALPNLINIAPNAVVITSPNGDKGLKKHYGNIPNIKTVNTGDSINIGKRTISFINTPMVHWPDNMLAYCPQEKILFSNDAFGQHIASGERFDDELPIEIIMEEAKKYYANIVLPYGNQVNKALIAASEIPIEIIAPSHGLIWRSNVDSIVKEYSKWANNNTKEKAVIIYDTMWQSTKKMAYAIANGFEKNGIPANIRNLSKNHISDIMTDIIDAKYICVGSPTLNNNMLPTVSAFLTYLKGLSPKKRTGLAFGSYGWGGQSVGQIEEILKLAGFDTLNSIKIQYIPKEEQLKEIEKNIKEISEVKS